MTTNGCNTRIGIGYDVHKLVPNRELIIGTITIKNKLGALGFSDADVLIHAIADALLGAAALGDIGQHFPDTDIKNKGLSGTILLSKVVELLKNANFIIVNVDSVVILQSPKIADYIPKMRVNIADILHIDISKVSVKATTTERLGFIGKSEGIAAEAVVQIASEG